MLKSTFSLCARRAARDWFLGDHAFALGDPINRRDPKTILDRVRRA